MNNTMKVLDSSKIRNIFKILFVIYLILLVKVILFKYPLFMITEMFKSSLTLSLHDRIMSSNFIPFKTISYYISGRPSIGVARMNTIGNILAFFPYGFIFPIAFIKKRKIKYIILFSFILSLLFEVIQFITTIGAFDVDDIMLNVLGAVLGYIVFRIFMKLTFSRKE